MLNKNILFACHFIFHHFFDTKETNILSIVCPDLKKKILKESVSKQNQRYTKKLKSRCIETFMKKAESYIFFFGL